MHYYLLDGPWLILISALVIAIYKYITRNNNYWKERNVPFIPPTFFFGNYYDLLTSKKCVGRLYRDIYNQFADSRFVGVFQFQRPNLMIRDPDDIKRVMISDFNHFQDRFQFTNTSADPLSNHLFNVEGEQWRPMRQKLSPTFSSGKLKNMFNLIVEVADEFSKFVEKNAMNEDADVRELSARYTTDVTKRERTENENSEFRKHGKKIVSPTWKIFIINLIRLYDVNLFRFFNINRFEASTTMFFLNLIKSIKSQRQSTDVVKRHDFIDLLLELKERDDKTTPLVMDDVFMASQTFIFFIAGFETSSTLMAFTLYQLAMHQDIQNKVAEETDKVLAKYDNKITYDSINEMPYLDLVICETQRFFPALTTINRICTSSYTFPESKLRIEKGTYVVIPVYALHFDSKYFPEPEKFIPERFSGDSAKERHPMTFLPFGEGPRNCIGLRLGKIQTKVGLVALLKDYKVVPSSQTPEKVRITPKSFVSAPEQNIILKFVKRN